MRLDHFARNCNQAPKRGRGGRGRYRGRSAGSYRGHGGYDQGNYGNGFNGSSELNRGNTYGLGKELIRRQAYGYNDYSSDPGSGYNSSQNHVQSTFLHPSPKLPQVNSWALPSSSLSENEGRQLPRGTV